MEIPVMLLCGYSVWVCLASANVLEVETILGLNLSLFLNYKIYWHEIIYSS